MKRVFIVHGWDGHPDVGWFPWLKAELEKKGYAVSIPQLPDANFPRINKWIPALTEVVGTPDEETYFVGHSMGCQAIVRYLETLSDTVKVGGAVFVAGFFLPITNLENDPESIDVDREWATTPINTDKVKAQLIRSLALFSTNDKYVALANREEFAKRLGSEIITQEKKGHFSESEGTTELPVVRDWFS